MVLEDDNETKAEFEVEYKGPLGFTLFWFLWSILGYLYMVLYSESPSASLEWFYLVLTILSVMALNNRKYGINHSIRFYKDYIIVPRLLNSWFWIEEKITYKDIDEIDYLDYGDGTTKNLCEITLKTKLFTYPIFGKKLRDNEFYNVMSLLRKKTKMRVPELPSFSEDNSPLKDCIKELPRQRLSPFDYDCHCDTKPHCLFAIINPNTGDFIKSDEIDVFVDILINSNYSIDYKLTKLVKDKNERLLFYFN